MPAYKGRPASEKFIVEFTGEGLAFNAVMEMIFEDDYFTYSLGSASSSYYFVVFPDGERLPLVEALSSGRVSIEDCIANGLQVSTRLKDLPSIREGGAHLALGHHTGFYLNGEPFYPSVYFMLRWYDDDFTMFRLDDLLQQGLSVTYPNGSREAIIIAGSDYYTVDMLEMCGITVKIDTLSGLFGYVVQLTVEGEGPHPSPFPAPLAAKLFTIEFTADPDTVFATALELIYEDEQFAYYLPVISSQYYFIVFEDGTRIPLMGAFDTMRVTIEDCIANGLEVIKSPRSPGTER
jgi:hypothetical protein